MTKESTLRFAPYDLPLILFFASAAVGIWPAYDPSLSAKTMTAFILLALGYLILSRVTMHRGVWHWAAAALAGLGVLFAGYYVTQTGHMQGMDKIGALSRLGELIARFTPNLAFFQPDGNSAGTFLEGLIFLQVGTALRAGPRRWKIVWWGSAALTAFALLLSASRGAWMAVFAGGLLWAALYWKPARYVLIAGVLGLAVLALIVAVSGDLTVLDRVPVAGKLLGALFIRPDRLVVYDHSLAMLSEAPFTGIGLGDQFAMTYARYQLYLHVPFLYYSHNLFLEIWLEQGLLGIFAFLWLVFSLLRSAWIFRGEHGRLRFESTWIGIVAILIHGLSDARQTQSLWCWLPFFGLLGVNAALITSRRVTGTRSLPRWLPAAASALALFVFWMASLPIAEAVTLNRGTLTHHRADLAPGLSDDQRAVLLDQAAADFERTLRVSASNFGANHRLGMITLTQGDYEAAIDHLERANQARPRHIGVRKLLGLAYVHHGDLEQAVGLFKDQLNIVDEMNYYGDLYERQGRRDLSLNFFQVSLLLNPDQAQVKQWVDEHIP